MTQNGKLSWSSFLATEYSTGINHVDRIDMLITD